MSEHIQIGDISPRIQYVADGDATAFTYPFPIFEEADLLVHLDDILQASGYTVSGAGETAGGAATFDTAPSAGVVVTLARRVPEERTSDFQEGGAFRAVVINTELDRIVCMVQQLRDELSRSVVRPATSTSTASLALPDPTAGRALKWNAAGDGLANSAVDPDTLASALTDAQAAQTAAEAAQGLAEDARDGAQGSAAAAASDAAAVAAALNSIGGEYVDRVSGDVVLTAASNKHVVIVDASAGQVVVTLPVGASIGEPGSISVQKIDNTTNQVLVRVQGTDTLNGGTADYELATQYQGARLAVNLDVAPDDWAALPFGVAVGDATPVGQIAPFAMGTVPSGWLECNGATVSRTTYANLFAAIGTVYGAGDGSTTFKLPDLRGEFLRGWDHGRGVDSGRSLGASQTDAFQGHKHDTGETSSGSVVNSYGLGSAVTGVGPSMPGYTYPKLLTSTPVTDGTNGTPRTAAETRPRNIAVMFCIKAFNAVTNQAMLEVGDLADDVASLSGRVDDLEASIGGYLHVREEQTSGTAGGTFTSGSYLTRTLNTVKLNTISGASLASNRITLPAGTYELRARATCMYVDKNRARIYDATHSVVLLSGPNGYTYTNYVGQTYYAPVEGRFTLTATSAIELQHRCSTTWNANGFGDAVNFGETEVYSEVFIEKVA